MSFLPFRFITLGKSAAHVLQSNSVNSRLGALGACKSFWMGVCSDRTLNRTYALIKKQKT